MSGWFVKKEEPKDKPIPDQGRTLVVVGLVFISRLLYSNLRFSFPQDVFNWQRTYSQSNCESLTNESVL